VLGLPPQRLKAESLLELVVLIEPLIKRADKGLA